MNNSVSIAYLQAPTTIRGLFEQATTLDASNNRQSKTPGIKLTMMEHGLLVSRDNISGVIPYTNVKVMVLASGEDNSKKSK